MNNRFIALAFTLVIFLLTSCNIIDQTPKLTVDQQVQNLIDKDVQYIKEHPHTSWKIYATSEVQSKITHFNGIHENELEVMTDGEQNFELTLYVISDNPRTTTYRSHYGRLIISQSTEVEDKFINSKGELTNEVKSKFFNEPHFFLKPIDYYSKLQALAKNPKVQKSYKDSDSGLSSTATLTIKDPQLIKNFANHYSEVYNRDPKVKKSDIKFTHLQVNVNVDPAKTEPSMIEETIEIQIPLQDGSMATEKITREIAYTGSKYLSYPFVGEEKFPVVKYDPEKIF